MNHHLTWEEEQALLEFRSAIRNWIDRVSRIRLETVVLNTTTGVSFDLQRGLYAGHETSAGLTSLAIHAAMIALLLLLGTIKGIRKVPEVTYTLLAPPPVRIVKYTAGGGGGGARQSEVKKADLPKPAPRLFTPPRVDTVVARLEVPASLAIDAPDIASTNVGNLTGVGELNGPGARGGIGTGPGRGLGPGPGNGAGPGPGGNGDSGVFRAGGGVTNPVPIYKPEPQYSEEARRAKWGGAVLISLVVDETGHTRDIKVIRPLGLGLDEKVIEAVSKWIFTPGKKDGKPVKVEAHVEVLFRLL